MNLVKYVTQLRRLLPILLVASALLLTVLSAAKAPTGDAGVKPGGGDARVPAAVDVNGDEDLYNRINTAVLNKGRVVESSVAELPARSLSKLALPAALLRQKEAEVGRQAREQQREKLHPALKAEVQKLSSGAAPDRTERVVVNFKEYMKIPRFPRPDVSQPRDSAFNQSAMARAAQMVEEIRQSRAPRYDSLAQELGHLYGARVTETFWLINGVEVELPLSAVSRLASRADVLYVEPSESGEAPPQNGNGSDDIDDGRFRIASDPYFNLGQTGGWIGLLDTGVRFSHTLFNNPSHIDFRRDCVVGGSDCNTMNAGFNPSDDCWNHGTSTADIITGNENMGFPFRGVSAITLDSFKVYPSGCGGLSTTAAVRGFQTAVAVLDRVIVAEMQGTGNDVSSISAAADNAFDGGAVVIAANGNNGPTASTVNTPANAHKVIGVGDLDVQTLAQINSQSRGPAPDGRIKPDIQAPTNTEAASNASDTALQIFTGTSGATPYAGGAAALLRNWLRGSNFDIDPGQVYAQMILSGQQSFFDNTTGAGLIQLPTDGTAWWGKISVGPGQSFTVPLNIGLSLNGYESLSGALWWPETAAQQHNDIDLYLIDPSGNTVASSISGVSVFERARFTGPLMAGTWTLRVYGYSVPTGAQTVYFAAHARPNQPMNVVPQVGAASGEKPDARQTTVKAD